MSTVTPGHTGVVILLLVAEDNKYFTWMNLIVFFVVSFLSYAPRNTMFCQQDVVTIRVIPQCIQTRRCPPPPLLRWTTNVCSVLGYISAAVPFVIYPFWGLTIIGIDRYCRFLVDILLLYRRESANVEHCSLSRRESRPYSKTRLILWREMFHLSIILDGSMEISGHHYRNIFEGVFVARTHLIIIYGVLVG